MEQIKLLNDLASSLTCYFTGEWNQGQLMHHLKYTLELPEEVLEHIDTIIIRMKTLEKLYTYVGCNNSVWISFQSKNVRTDEFFIGSDFTLFKKKEPYHKN